MVVLLDEPDSSSTYHEYFYNHEDLFDIIMTTHTNAGIPLKKIVKDISLLINTEIQYKNTINTKKTNDMMQPLHNLHIKRQKNLVDYTNNY